MTWRLFIAAVVGLVLSLVWLYTRDRRRERRPTRAALSPQVRAELEAEIADAVTRQARFRTALDAARNREPTGNSKK